jgi:hypothetical protein
MMSEVTSEKWTHVVGYKGLYEVSNRGRVRSLTRQITQVNGHVKTIKGAMLRLYEYGGYIAVFLWRNNKKSKRWVHDLVAHAFKGKRPAGAHICHRNGVSSCNHSGNLRYDTPKGNMADKRKHGTMPEGEKHPNAKLSTTTVMAIRGMSRGQVAKFARENGFDVGHCIRILRGEARANG